MLATQILISKRQLKTIELASPTLWKKLIRGDATVLDLFEKTKDITFLLQKPKATFDHQLGLALMTMVTQLKSLNDSKQKIDLRIY